MLERIKVCALAVGVCYPISFVVFGAAYLLGLATGYFLAATAVLGVLRIAWLGLGAAVRGRRVFELSQEPNVTAPILGLGPVPARPATGGSASGVPDVRGPQRTPALAEARLAADTQEV